MWDHLWLDNDDESVNCYRISSTLCESFTIHFSGGRNEGSSSVTPVEAFLKSVLPSIKTCHKSTTVGEFVSQFWKQGSPGMSWMKTIFWANCNKQGKVLDYQGFTVHTKMSRNNGQIIMKNVHRVPQSADDHVIG